MIIGVVNPQLEATVDITIVGLTGQSLTVTAVIDTGYNGSLSLPNAIVTALALPSAAVSTVTLGDATQKIFTFYRAEVLWDGQRRGVRVLGVEGDPLLGTGLLRGYKLSADFAEGGAVFIEPLP